MQIVWGAAPGWADPWSRARRVHVVSLNFDTVTVESDGLRWEIPRYDIQAVRPAPENPEQEEPLSK